MVKKKTIGIKRLREVTNEALKDVVGGCLYGYIIEQNDPNYCQKRAMELFDQNIKLNGLEDNKYVLSNLNSIICLAASAKAMLTDDQKVNNVGVV